MQILSEEVLNMKFLSTLDLFYLSGDIVLKGVSRFLTRKTE